MFLNCETEGIVLKNRNHFKNKHNTTIRARKKTFDSQNFNKPQTMNWIVEKEENEEGKEKMERNKRLTCGHRP